MSKKRVGLMLVGAVVGSALPAWVQGQVERDVACGQIEPLRIAYGDHTSGCEIMPPTESDRFSFVARAGDQVWILLASHAGGFDPLVQLFNPSGVVIATESCNAGCCGVCAFVLEPATPLPENGVYTFRVTDVGADDNGAYSVQLERRPEPRTQPLTYDAPVTSSIEPVTDVDWFSFAAQAGSQVQLSLRSLAGGYDPEVVVYGPDGAVVGSDDCNAGCCGDCTVLSSPPIATSGVYFVRVRDLGLDDVGGYELTLNCVFGDCENPPPNDDCTTSVTIQQGRTYFSTAYATSDGAPTGPCRPGEPDRQTTSDLWYRFTATCTGALQVGTLGDAGLDTKVAIYGTDDCKEHGGELLACSDNFAPGHGTDSFAVAYGIVAGESYLIRIGCAAGPPGSAALTVDNHLRSDWNRDCVNNSQDVFDFLSCFFSTTCEADFNFDGIANSQDFFDFIACWLSGC